MRDETRMENRNDETRVSDWARGCGSAGINEKYDHNFTPFVRTLRFASVEINISRDKYIARFYTATSALDVADGVDDASDARIRVEAPAN